MLRKPRFRRLTLASLLVLALALYPIRGDAYYMQLIQLTFIYFVVVAGLNIVSGYAGQLSVGHGALFGTGAYVSAVLTTNHGWPFPLAFVAAVVVTLILGIALGAPSLRLRHLYFAMMTLGFAIVFSQVLLNWQSITGGYLGVLGVPPVALFGHQFVNNGQYYFLLAYAVLCGWLVARLVRGKRGYWWTVTRDDEIAARSLGISPSRTKLNAFAVSAVLAGSAGSIYAGFIGVLQPDTFTLHLGLLLLAMMLLGGSGRAWGPIFGVPSLIALQNVAPSGTTDYFLGGALIVLTIFLPVGIAGLLSSPWLRRKSAARNMQLRRVELDARVWPTTSRHETVALQPHPGQQDTPTLEGAGLQKSYGGVQALEGIDLVVRPMTVHAVIGPNGCGKTTLLNLLSGFAKPDSGEVTLLGSRVGGLHAHQRANAGIARTFQTPRLSPSLTVFENVFTAASVPGARRAEDAGRRWVIWGDANARRRAHEAMQLAGVDHLGNELASDIPHAILRFVELARAIARQPSVILMDEPAGGLTGDSLDRLAELVRKIRDSGCSVVLVEHNVPFVMAVADEVTAIDRGRVIAHGLPEEVRQNAGVIEAYLGS